METLWVRQGNIRSVQNLLHFPAVCDFKHTCVCQDPEVSLNNNEPGGSCCGCHWDGLGRWWRQSGSYIICISRDHHRNNSIDQSFASVHTQCSPWIKEIQGPQNFSYRGVLCSKVKQYTKLVSPGTFVLCREVPFIQSVHLIGNFWRREFCGMKAISEAFKFSFWQNFFSLKILFLLSTSHV